MTTTRVEGLVEVIRGIAVAELRRRASQKIIEGEYLDGALISPEALARRDKMEERLAWLKVKMFESITGLTPRELDAMATEIEGLQIGGLR